VDLGSTFKKTGPFLLILLLGNTSLAAGRILIGDQEVASMDDQSRSAAKKNDPVLRRLTGIAFGRWQISGSGWVFNAQDNVSARLKIHSADIEMPLGEASLGSFEAIRLGLTDPYRLRFELARSPGAPFCHDEFGRVHLPFFGRLEEYCVPNAIFGVAFTALELQGDVYANKFAARWLEFAAETNFFGNGHGEASLVRKLALQLGASSDSIFGTTQEHHLRATVALVGLYRTGDGDWELRGKAAIRPSLISTVGTWSDRAWEAQLSVDRHFAVSRSWVMSLGLRMNYEKWDRPVASIAPLASSRVPENWSFALSWGGRFEFTGY
jgi:hypothetical protein